MVNKIEFQNVMPIAIFSNAVVVKTLNLKMGRAQIVRKFRQNP